MLCPSTYAGSHADGVDRATCQRFRRSGHRRERRPPLFSGMVTLAPSSDPCLSSPMTPLRAPLDSSHGGASRFEMAMAALWMAGIVKARWDRQARPDEAEKASPPVLQRRSAPREGRHPPGPGLHWRCAHREWLRRRGDPRGRTGRSTEISLEPARLPRSEACPRGGRSESEATH